MDDAPYIPSTGAYIPAAFAGRKDAYTFINQQLVNSTMPQAIAITGRAHIGKSALLWHFSDVFDETYIGVYLSVPAQPTPDALIRELANQTIQVLQERRFLVDRIPQPGDEINISWLEETFLPEVFRVIRAHRKLVWLFDDADKLFTDPWQAPFTTQLSVLLANEPQISLVVTLPDLEDPAPGMDVLVNRTMRFRLSNLTTTACAVLLRAPVQELYVVDDEAVQQVYAATGGVPLFVQQMCLAIFQQATSTNQHYITPEEVRSVIPGVYGDCNSEFQRLWETQNLNARLVLNAISDLSYQMPLVPVTHAAIESWLVQTDYPLDGTTIKAALRDLEYQELLVHDGDGVRTRTGLFQKWLLENARLDKGPDTHIGQQANPVRWVIALGLFVLIVAVLTVTWNTQRPPDIRTQSIPTVTLDAPTD